MIICPRGWKSNGDYCYNAVTSNKTFTYSKARSECLAENATLTSVTNREEQNFLNGKYRLTFVISPIFNGLLGLINAYIKVGETMPVT